MKILHILTIFGIFIMCLIGLYKLLWGHISVFNSMQIVGWDCNELIYEDHKKDTYKLGTNGHYYPVGKTEGGLK